MESILNSLYMKFRKKEVSRARLKLKKIKTDDVMQCINKNCWKYGINDEIVLKNNDVLVVRLSGKNRSTIIKYHKVDMVFWDDFLKFLNEIDSYEVKHGVYITTGVFENSILKNYRYKVIDKKIKFVDGITFIRYQLGLKGKVSERIAKNKLCFMKYFPY